MSVIVGIVSIALSYWIVYAGYKSLTDPEWQGNQTPIRSSESFGPKEESEQKILKLIDYLPILLFLIFIALLVSNY